VTIRHVEPPKLSPENGFSVRRVCAQALGSLLLEAPDVRLAIAYRL
jgi:hypothetical protein